MFEKIISWFKSEDQQDTVLHFGRYSDSFKSDKQVEYWNIALSEFEKSNYLEAYNNFFTYLLDEKEGNVKYTITGEEIGFEIYQGSKVVKGKTNKDLFQAEVILAEYKDLNLAVMRKLLEMNYTLQYSRYSINDNKISLKFDSSTLDGSPEKIYYALKEVAIKADKLDDLLLNEFPGLEQVDNFHVEEVNSKEKEIKIEFLQKWIRQTLTRISKIDRQRFEGSISYILLNLAYKIDYFLLPQGKLMNEIEKIHGIFFTNFELSKVERNNQIIKSFEKILAWSDEEIKRELYKVKATFGVTNPTAHTSVVQVLEEEMKSIDWYKKNNQNDMVVLHMEYISLYSLFNFGLRMPSRLLFDILIEVANPDFYKALNFKESLYDPEGEKLNGPILQKRLKHIVSTAEQKYPQLGFDNTKLSFNSRPEFMESMLGEIKKLNFNTVS